jgi:hypothetical protein
MKEQEEGRKPEAKLAAPIHLSYIQSLYKEVAETLREGYVPKPSVKSEYTFLPPCYNHKT